LLLFTFIKRHLFRNCKEDELINLSDITNKSSLNYILQAFDQDLYKERIISSLNMHNLKPRKEKFTIDNFVFIYILDKYFNVNICKEILHNKK